MARNFYTPINLNVLELQNAVIGNLTTTSINALSGANNLVKGRLQFDSTANTLKYYDGTVWQTVSTGGGSFYIGTQSISLGNSSGSVTALPGVTSVNGTTIPSSATLLTSVSTASALTSVGTLTSLTMGGAIAMGSSKITGLADPTAAQDAATKNYVDTLSQGLNIHDSVSLATTAAIVTGLVYTAGTTGADGGNGVGATLVFTAAAIDGTTLTSTDVTNGTRILVKDQSTQTQNGLYYVTAVSTNITLTRSTDADNHILRQISAGDFVYVTGGTNNAGKSYVQATSGTAVGGGVKIGTDSLVYNQFGSAGTVPYATTTTAGIASFATANFTVSGTGAVSITNLGTLAGTFSTSGANTLTLTTTGATNVTLPTTGTLAVTTAAQTFTGTQTFQAAATQDAIKIAGRAGGTGSFAATVSPPTLAANQNVTLPSATGFASTQTAVLTAKVTGSITLVANTTNTITHNLNSQAVVTQIFDSSWNKVEMDITNTSATVVTLLSQVAGTYNYVVIG